MLNGDLPTYADTTPILLESPPPYSYVDPLEQHSIIESKPWNSETVSYVGGDQLETQDIVHIASELSRNTCVKQLILSGNNAGVTDETIPALARSLLLNRTLTSLNLSSCSISLRGAAALGYVLQRNNTLEHLSLRDNALLEEGATAFLTGLSRGTGSRKNTCLKALNLSSNAIMTNGCNAVVVACLDHLHALQDLHLNTNAIDDESVEPLSKLISNHGSLKSLHLQWNLFSSRAVSKIDSCISNSPNLPIVDLRNNTKINGLKSASVKNPTKIIWKSKHGNHPEYIKASSQVKCSL